MTEHEKYMSLAIALSEKNIHEGSGGPFGAVIVKDSKVIAQSENIVLSTNDPTAHAEVSAIRLAAKALNSFDLSGCVIYTSCEPCPMCLGAIYWARISKIYYGNTRADAEEIGFADKLIYSELNLPAEKRQLPSEQILHSQSLAVFRQWQSSEGKKLY